MTHRNETGPAVAALIAIHRRTLVAVALLLAAVACAACYLLTTLAMTRPAHPYAVNVGSWSVGVMVEGCRVQAGYYDTRTQANDSGEIKIC